MLRIGFTSFNDNGDVFLCLLDGHLNVDTKTFFTKSDDEVLIGCNYEVVKRNCGMYVKVNFSFKGL